MKSYIKRKILISNNGNKIYGILYKPLIEGKIPIVVYSHELANNHERGIEYAKYLASNGIGCYVFDYSGGSNNSKSSGKTTEMSILTELSDLSCVIAYFRKEPYIDRNNLFIIGASLGGAVASLYTSKNIDKINSLILLYPGFNVYDSVHEFYESLDDVPNEFSFKGWMDVGKIFIKDAWNTNIYDYLVNIKIPVLILHGEKDNLVPLEYSKKAVDILPNANLTVIKGASHHIFFKEYQKLAQNYILEFIKNNLKWKRKV